ncbi:hypothetical protein [Streptomyces sp. HB2AG]|uniref:hypothetical protein n=1 Tax=Streptomyces sp. HB2AG TaxID=2983400 RepID=UPI0022AA7A97|nr:hypothetical protein [Streptomyces sp. HB2AG]MCZ2525920.1 hypothetical protein [Streptomyces sp. HB2AG]
MSGSPFDPPGVSTTSAVSAGGAGGGGGQFSVEVAYLKSIIRPLRGAMHAGRQVSEHPEQLREGLLQTGSGKFAVACERFIGAWEHGMGLLADDAEMIADRLQETVDAYTEAEEQLAEGFRPGVAAAASGGTGGSGPVTSWVQENVIDPTGMNDLTSPGELWKTVFG